MCYFKRLIYIIPVLLLVACQTSNTIPIKFENNPTIDNFISFIDYIEVLPLENDGVHYLGSEPELFMCGDNYVIVDKFNKSIYRYSPTGEFLNKIGNYGNGPFEYSTIDNIQVLSDKLINVYSTPGKVMTFTETGDFVKSTTIKNHGIQTYHVDNGYLIYFGNGKGTTHRLFFVGEGQSKKMLDATDKVLNFSNNVPLFSENRDGSIAVLDSYNPIIYKYKNKILSEYIVFDFSETSIPSLYYKQEDPFIASNMLFSHDFSFVRRYFENEDYSFVEVYTRHPSGPPTFTYGIKSEGVWKWFSTGQVGQMPLTASFRTIDSDNFLYAIVDPLCLNRCQPEILDKVNNHDILKSINQEDNYVIFKVKLN